MLCEDYQFLTGAAIQTTWFLQDALAGITVGLLVIPQGIAYGAGLNPEVNIKKKRVVAALIVYRVIPQHR